LISEPVPGKPIRNPLLRIIVLACGWLCVVLGIAGIPLPILPTTPFLLLAAACFLRSSPRFYQWLVNHPRLGKYILSYLDGKGIPIKGKIYTLVLMWSTLLVSAFVVVDVTAVKIVLPLIGLGVSCYILRLPTLHTD